VFGGLSSTSHASRITLHEYPLPAEDMGSEPGMTSRGVLPGLTT
jgi:hypothetical protein